MGGQPVAGRDRGGVTERSSPLDALSRRLVAEAAESGEPALLAELFARRRPEVVFHAAALKHLPVLMITAGSGSPSWRRNSNSAFIESRACLKVPFPRTLSCAASSNSKTDQLSGV